MSNSLLVCFATVASLPCINFDNTCAMMGLTHPQPSSQEIPKQTKPGSTGVVEPRRILLVHHFRLQPAVKKQSVTSSSARSTYRLMLPLGYCIPFEPTQASGDMNNDST